MHWEQTGAWEKQHAGTAENASDYQEESNVGYQGSIGTPRINNWHYSEHQETEKQLIWLGYSLKIFSWFQHEE